MVLASNLSRSRRRRYLASFSAWLAVSVASGFVPLRSVAFRRQICKLQESSIGGGNQPPNEGPPDNRGFGEWDDFLDPNKEESESLQRAREYMSEHSENSLPISFNEKNAIDAERSKQGMTLVNTSAVAETNSSAIVSTNMFSENPSESAIANNPYMQVVAQLTPSELISKFTSTAHPRVQTAVRNTILGLIGGLPKMAFETTTVTSGQRLASLMFQLQMTGYMFKNAEYRLSVQQSLGGGGSDGSSSSQYLLASSEDEDDGDDDDTSSKKKLLLGKPRGKFRLRYGSSKVNGTTSDDDSDGPVMEVDADAFTSELRKEVSQLRAELEVRKKEKDEAWRKDLLAYIRTLPEQELRGLTSTMSQEVLIAMKGLVNAVMAGVGDGQIGPDTLTEQSGESMAQLCMWQLVIGYNLRTLEVREQMKQSLMGSSSDKLDVMINASADDGMPPGAFE